MRISTLFLVLLITASLSGCTASNSPDGQTAATAGSLAYNGASVGSHTSTPRECDGSGTVSLTYNLGSGSVTFAVKDGAGTQVWSNTYSNVGQGSDSVSVSGAAGDWVLEATRSGGQYGSFSGQYGGSIDC